MWSCIKKTVDTDTCTMYGQIKTRENQWIKTPPAKLFSKIVSFLS